MANTEMPTKEFEIQSFQIKIEMEKVEERYKKGPQQEEKKKKEKNKAAGKDGLLDSCGWEI